MASLTTAASMRLDRRLWITGGLLCVWTAALAALAMTIGDVAATPENRRLMAAWGVTAGLVYFAGFWASREALATTRGLVGVLAIGFAMRVVVIATPPFLEVDYHRYLWDGAVAAHGMNPYQRSPAEALASLRNEDDSWLPEPLRTPEAIETLARVNHPQLTTVYGPIAQTAFAAAHWLAPWSMTGWRAVLLLFDGLTVGLVLALLRALGASRLWVAWYWWNPLLLREVFSSGHMDLLALPLVLLGILLALRRRAVWASAALALAAGVKTWPVLLLPLVLKAAARDRRAMLVPAALTFVALSVLIWSPAFSVSASNLSGFRAFADRWQNNASLFAALHHAAAYAAPRLGLHAMDAGPAVRWGVAALVALLILHQTLRLRPDSRLELIRRSTLVLAAAFILSPVQLPWYYLWMLPLLAAAPGASLLFYSVTLPLYYVHYDHAWIVWLEHLPIAAWLAAECYARHQRPAAPESG